MSGHRVQFALYRTPGDLAEQTGEPSSDLEWLSDLVRSYDPQTEAVVVIADATASDVSCWLVRDAPDLPDALGVRLIWEG